MFAALDESVDGTIHFGDGSVGGIQARGIVVFECLIGDHRVRGDVYFIPNLFSNIISLGQLDESGCKITMVGSIMCIIDKPRKILARLNHSYRKRGRRHVPRSRIDRPGNGVGYASGSAWFGGGSRSCSLLIYRFHLLS
jgi:hypothetical protein